jgi:hypothetical protein
VRGQGVSEGVEEPLVDYLVAHPEMVTAILDRHVATPSGACAGWRGLPLDQARRLCGGQERGQGQRSDQPEVVVSIAECGRLSEGERNILGELRGERRKIGFLGEVGVPAVEVGGELVVEDPGADLEEPRMC